VPIIEYKCLNCNTEFEELVIDADEEIMCYSCNSKDLEKQFSPFGIKAEGEVASAGLSSSGCGCTPVGCGCSVRN